MHLGDILSEGQLGIRNCANKRAGDKIYPNGPTLASSHLVFSEKLSKDRLQKV